MNTKLKNYFDPFVNLLPFLFIYILILVLFSKKELVGDEGRYIFFAENILKGYYSPPYPNINLWNGPGYPIILVPFVALGLPQICIKLLNCFLLYFSLIIFYKTCLLVLSLNRKYVLGLTTLLGLYYPIYHMLPLIYSEIFTWFLITLFFYLFIKFCKNRKVGFKRILPISFTLAFIVLTKIIFGYVLIAMVVLLAFVYLFSKQRIILDTVKIFLLSIIFCTPWLFYTYHITGKVCYWGNSGGMSLYTLSVPYDEELGDWFKGEWDEELSPKRTEHHKSFFDSLSNLDPIQRDEAFKQQAMKNIRENPLKYIKNWIANIGRLLFNYPYSYTNKVFSIPFGYASNNQSLDTFITLLPNIFIFVALFFSSIPFFIKIRKVDFEIIILFLFVIIYLICSSLVSAYIRQFYILIPYWFLFIGYILNKIICISYRD